MGFMRDIWNRKVVDALHEKVKDKGYIANRIVDGIKSVSVDENNPGYGIQKNPVTRDYQYYNQAVVIDTVRAIERAALPEVPGNPLISGYLAMKQELETVQEPEPEKPSIFDSILGHEPLKEFMTETMEKVEEGELLHTLLLGSAGGAKSMFLDAIANADPKHVFKTVGMHATKAAINDKLYNNAGQIKYLVIDEIDKMSEENRQGLLDIMSSGYVTEAKMHRTRQAKVNVCVIAAANDISGLSKELKSRFFVTVVQDYKLAEFKQLARFEFKNKFDEETADYIAEKVWTDLGSRDFRDVLKIGKRIKSKSDVDKYIGFMPNAQDV